MKKNANELIQLPRQEYSCIGSLQVWVLNTLTESVSIQTFGSNETVCQCKPSWCSWSRGGRGAQPREEKECQKKVVRGKIAPAVYRPQSLFKNLTVG